MKKVVLFFAILCSLSFMIACNSDAPKEEEKFKKELSFSEYDLDFSIKGPEGAVIEKNEDSPFPHEYEVSGAEYLIEVLGQKATEADRRVIKRNALEEMKKNPAFEVNVPLDEDFGFVYSKKFSGDTTQYFNFYYVTLNGDMQFLFNTNGTEKFTQKQVTAMYEAVKQE